MSDIKQQNDFLKSNFPVLFPRHPALAFAKNEFEAFLKNDAEESRKAGLVKSAANFPRIGSKDDPDADVDFSDTTTVTSTSTWAKVALGIENTQIDDHNEGQSSGSGDNATPEHPFMKALADHDKPKPRSMANMMATENNDLAFRSTKSALVDLFYELEDVVSRPRLLELLKDAWEEDSLATLKIIFNARSIHLGKSSRPVFYRCLEWLSKNHPTTCLTNLQWLSRPVIEKKAEKKGAEDDDTVVIDMEKNDDDQSKYDVRHGVAHGYYKDLLNILVLTANDSLDNPRQVLNVDKPKKKGKQNLIWDQEKAREERHKIRDARHEIAVQKFHTDAFYRGLHLTVARIFAEQLAVDLNLLRSEDPKARRHISLCAKWAPSHKLFHDRHTFIVSSIAEILHPQTEFADITDRETFLRHARESYRKDVSSLRKALEIVERDISVEKFENIKYERVPSLAMNQYASLFAQKDENRFDEYLDKVASGKKQISGATLLPSTLVHNVRSGLHSRQAPTRNRTSAKAMIKDRMNLLGSRVVDGQWKTLVKRIKDSGKLRSSIAVCDVSGSMCSPTFPDDTCPMDSSIGLSLLLAEVVEPPFGGAFITFSEKPALQKIDLSKPFSEKVDSLSRAHWSMSTDFVAVFEKLILPAALEHKVKQEDMVKQVFVFSDMQFNQASRGGNSWTTSYERIQKKYQSHGYEMPELVFWNLAGGRAGYTGSNGDPTAPKPVTHDQLGTALVSGYSQGMLKVFLDNGSFEEPEDGSEEEILEKVEVDEEGEEVTVVQKAGKKQKKDPLDIVKKAISHHAYSMLRVVD